MNKKIQEKIDKQLAKGNTPPVSARARVVGVADAPLLSSDAVERDQREQETVEINFKDMSARVVEKSKAPKLTLKYLKEFGKPIKSVEFFFDNGWHTVFVRDGIPQSLEIERAQLENTYTARIEKLNETDADTTEAYKAIARERNQALMQLTLARMIADPVLSFQGQGEGIPVENFKLMFDSVWQAFAVANYPADDAIFQVDVVRGVPLDTAVLLQQGLEAYPLGELDKRTLDLTSEEIQALELSGLNQRRILVASMVRFPAGFSFNGVGKKKSSFPVENVCERFLKTLHNAYKVVNVPQERLASLRRFSGLGDEHGTGQGVGNEPVGDDKG